MRCHLRFLLKDFLSGAHFHFSVYLHSVSLLPVSTTTCHQPVVAICRNRCAVVPSDYLEEAMSTMNVFMGNLELTSYPAGRPASAIYNTLYFSYGRGTLLGPDGVGIVSDDNPVPAGTYEYKPAPAVVPGVTAERESPLKRAKVADAVESYFERFLQLPEKLVSTEGESLLKGPKLTDAMASYFERLLQPPEKLPDSDADLKKFLSLVPVKLPIRLKTTYHEVQDKGLVTLDRLEETDELAFSVEFIVKNLDNSHRGNFSEADSSADLRLATGGFLRYLDSLAPRARKLRRLEGFLDSSNLTTSTGSSKPLLPLRRPDFQLYVSNCLILRWENKSDPEGLSAAMEENISKLKKWSTMYYGELPYVIGGACAGRMFTWLRLFSTGESLDYGVISPVYDLTKTGDVVALLQSTVRMHCLLQKLQEKLDGCTSLRLYETKQRRDGNTVTFYPEMVMMVVQLSDERVTQLESLYEAVDGSLYVIQQEGMTTTRGRTKMLLHPVGYPKATPLDLKEVEDATHDILHGLSDLHSAGFTHRDIRWENIVKVPIKGNWKYVIIDLEEGGPDKEEWKGEKLQAWDTKTLDRGKRYTTRSDMHQFGKLVNEWLSTHQDGSKEERDKVTSWGNQMEKKLKTAAKMLERICKKGCERCRTFGKAGNPPPPLP